jgi:hypothetical protein
MYYFFVKFIRMADAEREKKKRRKDKSKLKKSTFDQ